MRTTVLAVLLALPTSMASAQHLTIDDLLNAGGTRGAGAGLLSPNGLTFASTEHGQLVLRPVEGGASTPLNDVPQNASEFSWSHDGKQLAFVSHGNIWTVAIATHSVRQLTHDPAGPGDPRGATDHRPLWSPDGRWILYQSGRKGFNELYVVQSDGTAEHLLAATELYTGADVIPQTTVAPDRGDAVSSDRFDPEPAWSPDGESISYTERSRPYFSGKLNVLAFDSSTGAPGTIRTVYTAGNDPGGAWAVNTAAWSPDSRTLAVVLQDSGWDKLWLIPATGGKPQALTRGTGEDESPLYSPDGHWIVFTSNRVLPEERHLWLVPAKGGTPHRLTDLPGIESTPQWSPDSHLLYFTHATALHAGVPFVASVEANTAAPHSLAPVTPSKFEELGITPEVAHFKGKDGLALSGILFKPAHFDPRERYPAVIWAHGGPEAQVMLSLDPWALFLADHGFVVFEPNFRGSTGYGERFRNSNVEDSGGGEIDDIASSVQYLVAQGIADPKRVAIGGGSHGGTVVANAVAKLPGTFAAGIEMFGVVDRALFLQYTNRNSRIRWETKMGGTPTQKPAVYKRANVLSRVQQINTPLLVLHGEQDPQVPPQESQEFVAALKQAGKPVSYVTYPNEGHGFTQPAHRKDAYERQIQFLDEQLLGPKSK